MNHDDTGEPLWTFEHDSNAPQDYDEDLNFIGKGAGKYGGRWVSKGKGKGKGRKGLGGKTGKGKGKFDGECGTCGKVCGQKASMCKSGLPPYQHWNKQKGKDESPRRGPTFVTRKITRGLNMILTGERQKLVLGNIDAKRDWGHAKDYCYGMWLMLQKDYPDDYILATNEYHTVREFIEYAFKIKGFNIKWKGSGVNEVGYDENSGRELINISEKYFRPCEVDELLGDSSKAKEKLGWECKYDFNSLVNEMVKMDCK